MTWLNQLWQHMFTKFDTFITKQIQISLKILKLFLNNLLSGPVFFDNFNKISKARIQASLRRSQFSFLYARVLISPVQCNLHYGCLLWARYYIRLLKIACLHSLCSWAIYFAFTRLRLACKMIIKAWLRLTKIILANWSEFLSLFRVFSSFLKSLLPYPLRCLFNFEIYLIFGFYVIPDSQLSFLNEMS